MDERRRNNRMQLDGKLIVKRIGSTEEPIEVTIDVIDVSKTGIGFTCPEKLRIGAVYETFLTIWTKEVIHVFMEIVRMGEKEDGYTYGSIFIGMPETDASRISVYETIEKEKKNQQ